MWILGATAFTTLWNKVVAFIFSKSIPLAPIFCANSAFLYDTCSTPDCHVQERIWSPPCICSLSLPPDLPGASTPSTPNYIPAVIPRTHPKCRTQVWCLGFPGFLWATGHQTEGLNELLSNDPESLLHPWSIPIIWWLSSPVISPPSTNRAGGSCECKSHIAVIFKGLIQISVISITQDDVGNTNSQVSPQTYWLRNWGQAPANRVLTNPPYDSNVGLSLKNTTVPYQD